MISTAAEFVRLRDSEDPDDYRRAASEEAPLEVWFAVINDYPSQRRWVAHNKTVPPEILRVLASDPDPEVRWVVASRRQTIPEVLGDLAKDRDETVRQRVARNPSTPASVLQALSKDQSNSVRAAAEARLTSGA